jgi:hypothetical protein
VAKNPKVSDEDDDPWKDVPKNPPGHSRLDEPFGWGVTESFTGPPPTPEETERLFGKKKKKPPE